MLSNYKKTIDSLPAECRGMLLKGLNLPFYPQHLYLVLEAAKVQQADIVVLLLRGNTRSSIGAAERLIGHRIKHYPASRLSAAPIYSLYAKAQWVEKLLGPDKTIDSDKRKIVRVERNPRLPTTDSFQRWRLLRIGMTVQQFLVRGGTRRDLREWTNEGTLELR